MKTHRWRDIKREKYDRRCGLVPWWQVALCWAGAVLLFTALAWCCR